MDVGIAILCWVWLDVLLGFEASLDTVEGGPTENFLMFSVCNQRVIKIGHRALISLVVKSTDEYQKEEGRTIYTATSVVCVVRRSNPNRFKRTLRC